MLKSFRDAWNGIVLAVRTQRNVRVQLIVMVLMMAAGVYLSISYIDGVWLFWRWLWLWD